MGVATEQYEKLALDFRDKYPAFDKVWLTGSMGNLKDYDLDDKTCYTHLHAFDSSNGMRFTVSIESDKEGHFSENLYEKLYSDLDQKIKANG